MVCKERRSKQNCTISSTKLMRIVMYRITIWQCRLHGRLLHGPLTRYVKLQVVHAPGMPGTFSPPRLQRKPLVSDPGMHHDTYVTHVTWCMSESLTRGGGENIPSIPGICATHNFTCLERGPWPESQVMKLLSHQKSTFIVPATHTCIYAFRWDKNLLQQSYDSRLIDTVVTIFRWNFKDL